MSVYKAQPAKGKVPRDEDQGQLLLAKSHRMPLIHLLMGCDNPCETASIGGTPLSPGVQGSHWGSVMQSPFAQHAPKFQASGREAGARRKPSCSYRVSAQRAAPVSSGRGETPQVQVPRSQPRTTLANSLKLALLALFCMTFQIYLHRPGSVATDSQQVLGHSPSEAMCIRSHRK